VEHKFGFGLNCVPSLGIVDEVQTKIMVTFSPKTDPDIMLVLNVYKVKEWDNIIIYSN
jgi:hypothetical protein